MMKPTCNQFFSLVIDIVAAITVNLFLFALTRYLCLRTAQVDIDFYSLCVDNKSSFTTCGFVF